MHSIARWMRVAIITAAPLAPVSGHAQDRTVGTLLIAHGGGPEWNAQVTTVASLARTGGPLEVSFLMGPGAVEHRFQDAAARLVARGAEEIVVVPLLVSSHSGHFEQIRYLVGDTETLDEVMHHHLHMAGIERAQVDVPIRLTRAIDDSPEAADVLAARALGLTTSPGSRALFLMAHGPNSAEDNAAWMAGLRVLAERVQNATGFRSVMIGTVRDDAPEAVRAEAVRAIREVIALQHMATGEPVVVVPVLISTGQVSREKFPRDLEGLPVVYRGDALLPHPDMARWIEARVLGAGESGVGAGARESGAGSGRAESVRTHH